MVFGMQSGKLAGAVNAALQISKAAVFIENALRLVDAAPRLYILQTYTQ